MPKSRLIAAAILDLPSPLVALSTLPNLPLLLKSKMVAIAFAHPPKTPTLQALILKACFFPRIVDPRLLGVIHHRICEKILDARLRIKLHVNSFLAL